MTLPAVVPVTFIEHVPPAVRPQVDCEGRLTAPVPPDTREKVTVSPVMLPVVPATVPVQVEVDPIATGEVHATVVVVAAIGFVEYWNVVVIVAVPPGPPHVAFTEYVPATQFAVPPGTRE